MKISLLLLFALAQNVSAETINGVLSKMAKYIKVGNKCELAIAKNADNIYMLTSQFSGLFCIANLKYNKGTIGEKVGCALTSFDMTKNEYTNYNFLGGLSVNSPCTPMAIKKILDSAKGGPSIDNNQVLQGRNGVSKIVYSSSPEITKIWFAEIAKAKIQSKKLRSEIDRQEKKTKAEELDIDTKLKQLYE
jgi:hypothetical protein